jgi:hypothetical protein
MSLSFGSQRLLSTKKPSPNAGLSQTEATFRPMILDAVISPHSSATMRMPPTRSSPCPPAAGRESPFTSFRFDHLDLIQLNALYMQEQLSSFKSKEREMDSEDQR